MKKWFLLVMMCSCLAVGCSNDSSNSSGSQTNTDSNPQPGEQADNKDKCESPKVLCGESCLDLSALHLKDCNACEDGYEAKEDDLAKGCKEKETKPECSVGVDCDGNCVVLSEKHWKSCNECEAGYADTDGDASNG